MLREALRQVIAKRLVWDVGRVTTKEEVGLRYANPTYDRADSDPSFIVFSTTSAII